MSLVPQGDYWKLIDNDKNSQHYGKYFIFNFEYMKKAEIKAVVKAYIWRNYREENRTIIYLYDIFKEFKHFYKFAQLNNIDNFNSITNNEVSLFISQIKTSLNNNGKPYSYKSQKNKLDALKAIIYWGRLYMPEKVPSQEIFTGNEFLGVNRKLKIDYIPDMVIKQINDSLISENNPYTKYGIIILELTGMRVGDLLKLEIDCFKKHPIDGFTLSWYDHKNRKERPPIPVKNECVTAINRLIEYTSQFRSMADESIRNFLFIHQWGKTSLKEKKITIMSQANFSYLLNGWKKSGNLIMPGFVREHNIKNENGEIFNLKSHQFRRTLGTDMFSNGADLEVIREILGHASPLTSKEYYADFKDAERIKTFDKIGIIGDINYIDSSSFENQDYDWFKNNKNSKARMVDGYCTKPCKNGQVCERLLKRRRCYTCSRYITTPEFLEYHQNELNGLLLELNNNVYGEHYAKHLEETISILRYIVKRLEQVKNESTHSATAN